MTKQEEFNRIKAVLENKENNANHLEALRIKVNNFRIKYKESNLSDSLNLIMIKLEQKFKI